ncbi:MAG: sulfite exporter TauE/SafE family protein [Marinilabiliales bacterium]|nr:sulfite exporter TauE/SafE family protein [Marinilabiliales bacterium]
MTVEGIVLTFLLFAAIATLYSSVGHAGSSGYLALMALLSFAPETIKPTSLVLNIIVASIASYKFIKEGCFDKKVFLPFVLASIPMAFIGGYITLNPKFFKLVAGLFLVIAALLLVVREYSRSEKTVIKKMHLPYGLGIGGAIGLISGLIGVGGGIFLSPIIISAKWTTVKKASGIAAMFILCNSVAGLSGHLAGLNKIDHYIIYWIPAVVLGGLLGSHLGTVKLNTKVIIACLFLVLLTAGLKFLLVDFPK